MSSFRALVWSKRTESYVSIHNVYLHITIRYVYSRGPKWRVVRPGRCLLLLNSLLSKLGIQTSLSLATLFSRLRDGVMEAETSSRDFRHISIFQSCLVERDQIPPTNILSIRIILPWLSSSQYHLNLDKHSTKVFGPCRNQVKNHVLFPCSLVIMSSLPFVPVCSPSAMTALTPVQIRTYILYASQGDVLYCTVPRSVWGTYLSFESSFSHSLRSEHQNSSGEILLHFLPWSAHQLRLI